MTPDGTILAFSKRVIFLPAFLDIFFVCVSTGGECQIVHANRHGLDTRFNRRICRVHFQPGAIGNDFNEDLLAFCIAVFADILNIVEREVHSCRIALVNMNGEIVCFGVRLCGLIAKQENPPGD